jgi:hypothetical protein
MTKFVMAFVAAGALFTAAACSSDPAPTAAGGKCGEDSECNTGLKCLEYVVITAGGCQINGKQCTATCTTDDDCNVINKQYTKNFKCKPGCTAGSVTCQQ